MARRVFTPEEQALMRQGSLRRAAQVGMNKRYAEIVREQKERARMVELARGIHTEEMLQAILADVPEHMRADVEKVLRPHTRIKDSVHG